MSYPPRHSRAVKTSPAEQEWGMTPDRFEVLADRLLDETIYFSHGQKMGRFGAHVLKSRVELASRGMSKFFELIGDIDLVFNAREDAVEVVISPHDEAFAFGFRQIIRNFRFQTVDVLSSAESLNR